LRFDAWTLLDVPRFVAADAHLLRRASAWAKVRLPKGKFWKFATRIW
jgi:hypothetical protein